jgi:hypothetical protein
MQSVFSLGAAPHPALQATFSPQGAGKRKEEKQPSNSRNDVKSAFLISKLQHESRTALPSPSPRFSRGDGGPQGRMRGNQAVKSVTF